MENKDLKCCGNCCRRQHGFNGKNYLEGCILTLKTKKNHDSPSYGFCKHWICDGLSNKMRKKLWKI